MKIDWMNEDKRISKDRKIEPTIEKIPLLEAPQSKKWVRWAFGIGVFLIILILLLSAMYFLQPYIYRDADLVNTSTQKIQTQYGLLEKNYDLATKEISLTSDSTKEQILTSRLDTPQIYSVGAGYQKVAQFTINPNQDLNNVLGSFEFYDVNNNMKPVSKQVDINYLTTKQVEINDYILQCGNNKTGDATCQNIKSGSHFETKETWETFDGNIKTDEPIVIGLFTNVGIDEHIEWIPTIAGVKVQEWAEWTSNLFTDLIMFYQFNETSGTTVHDFQGNFTGTAINTENADWVGGVLDNALNMDGVDEYINTTYRPNYGLANNFTISFWFKNRYMNAGEAVWGSESCPSGSEFVFQVNGATGTDWRMRIIGSGDTTNYNIAQNLSKGTFQHIVIVRNTAADQIKIYVNGTSVSNTTDGSLNPINLATCPIYIGAVDSLGTTANGNLNATIDLFGVWNRTLNSTEISALYNAGVGITPPPTLSASLNLNLISPEDGINFTTNTINFSANVSINGIIAVQNVTINVTYLNGTSAYTNVNTSGFLGFYNWTNINFSDGYYNWIVYAYGNDSIRYNAINGTLFFNVDLIEPTITLDSPTNATESNRLNWSLVSNLTAGNYTLNNATIRVWYTNGTLYKSQNNATIAGTSDVILNNTFSNVPFGFTYIWNVYLNYQNPTLGTFNTASATNNFTFIRLPFEITAESFNNFTLETDSETFYINISTVPDILSTSINLVYDNNSYFVETNCVNSECILEKTIDISLVSSGNNENKTFFWELRLFDGTQSFNLNTTPHQQNVSRIYLSLINDYQTNQTLNFTLKDEINRTELNPMSFESTFNSWLGSGTVLRNITFSNLSANSDILISINPSNRIFRSDAFIEYNAVGALNGTYTKRNYHLQNASLTNVSNNISLFVLKTEFSTSFIQRVVTTAQNPIESALILSQRYYPNTDSFETVQIYKTDENGQTIGFFQTEIPDYRTIIIKNNEVLKTTDRGKIIPSSAPFTLSFTIGDILENPWTPFEGIPNLQSTLTFNDTTNIVTYSYVDTSGLTTQGNLLVYSQNSTSLNNVFCNSTSSLTAGTLTCNLTSQEGTFLAQGWISQSPAQLDKLISITISAIKNALAQPFLLLWIIFLIGTIGLSLFYPPAGIVILGAVLALGTILGIVGISWIFVWAIIAVGVWVLIETSS